MTPSPDQRSPKSDEGKGTTPTSGSVPTGVLTGKFKGRDVKYDLSDPKVQERIVNVLQREDSAEERIEAARKEKESAFAEGRKKAREEIVSSLRDNPKERDAFLKDLGIGRHAGPLTLKKLDELGRNPTFLEQIERDPLLKQFAEAVREDLTEAATAAREAREMAGSAAEAASRFPDEGAIIERVSTGARMERELVEVLSDPEAREAVLLLGRGATDEERFETGTQRLIEDYADARKADRGAKLRDVVQSRVEAFKKRGFKLGETQAPTEPTERKPAVEPSSPAGPGAGPSGPVDVGRMTPAERQKHWEKEFGIKMPEDAVYGTDGLAARRRRQGLDAVSVQRPGPGGPAR